MAEEIDQVEPDAAKKSPRVTVATTMAIKRGRVRLREFHTLNEPKEVERIWMVVGLVNLMAPWLGSALDGDQIAELINRPNVDVEFTLDS